MKHAKLSSSQLSRIDACTPSFWSNGDSESEYATEGTQFAEYAEKYIKREIDIVQCPQEFQGSILEYEEVIRHHVGEKPSVELLEERLGNDEEGGTPDYAGICQDEPSVGVIIDIKYGMGVDVQAEDNKQLLDYAYHFQNRYPGLTKFKLIIFQPRSYKAEEPVKVWEVDGQEVAEMASFRRKLRTRIKEIETFGERDSDFNEGDHCQFCPRILSCPKKMSPTTTAVTTIGESDGVATLDKQQVYQLVLNKKRIEKVLKAADEFVQTGLRNGSMTPDECGLKIVESNGRRKWKEGIEKKLMRNFKKANTHESKLIAITTLETNLKRQGLFDDKAKNVIAACVEKPKGEKLVPVSVAGEHRYATTNDFEIIDTELVEEK